MPKLDLPNALPLEMTLGIALESRLMSDSSSNPRTEDLRNDEQDMGEAT